MRCAMVSHGMIELAPRMSAWQARSVRERVIDIQAQAGANI
ncbi:hypothetical protein BURPS668_A1982 [Burkholderia pseudomallei 668]|nr:hypothetical protein BURPS668_A1982 [Burkholderia pseudomallei 668]